MCVTYVVCVHLLTVTYRGAVRLVAHVALSPTCFACAQRQNRRTRQRAGQQGGPLCRRWRAWRPASESHAKSLRSNSASWCCYFLVRPPPLPCAPSPPHSCTRALAVTRVTSEMSWESIVFAMLCSSQHIIHRLALYTRWTWCLRSC